MTRKIFPPIRRVGSDGSIRVSHDSGGAVFRPPESRYQPAYTPIEAGTLSDLLNKSEHQSQRTRLTNKDTYFVHVSDLMKSDALDRLCPREYVYRHTYTAEPSKQTVMAGMQFIHAMGRAVEATVKSKLRRFLPKDEFSLYGAWACACSDRPYEDLPKGTQPPVTFRCKDCRQAFDKYEELRLEHHSTRVVGRPDMLLLSKGWLHIVEIKSIEQKDTNFDTMVAPLAQHWLQASFYYWISRDLYLAGELPSPPAKDIRFLYVDRSTSKIFAKCIAKEFVVPVMEQDRLHPYMLKAVEIRNHLRNNSLPVRICDSRINKRACRCNMVLKCFSDPA